MNALTEYFPLPLAACIEVSDEDAADFLQSQFSNDLRVPSGHFVHGLWLDHRGKIHGDSFIFPLEDGRFRVISHGTQAKDLIAKLDAHIIADEVILEDRTTTTIVLALVGEQAQELLLAAGWTLPEKGRFATKGDCLLCALSPESLGGWMLSGTRKALDEWVQSLPETVLPTTDEAWQWARIEAKIPLIPAEIGPEETPNDVGMEFACSWNKGCFLGQEVVARQHRLDRASRSLIRVSLSQTLPPEALPADLFLDEAKVGNLRALAQKNGQVQGLALVKSRILEPGKAIEFTVGSFNIKALCYE